MNVITSEDKWNGPKAWKILYDNLIPIFGPNILIAGGSPRDFALGHRPKDYDIWVPVTDVTDFEMASLDMAENRHFNSVKICSTGDEKLANGDNNSSINRMDENGAVMSDIVGVIKAMFATDYAINGATGFGSILKMDVIGVDPSYLESPETLVARFDYDLCKFWVDKTDLSVYNTPEAQRSLETGYLSRSPGFEKDPRTDIRIAKFLNKYVNMKKRFFHTDPKKDMSKEPKAKTPEKFLKDNKKYNENSIKSNIFVDFKPRTMR